MENLVFSLNATVPVFVMMVLGYVLHAKTRLVSSQFAAAMNTFVFQLALPVQLFKNLAESDFTSVWNGKAVLFCFFASLLSILLALAASFRLQDRTMQAEFVQGAYRGSQALLGAALLQNIYGSTGSLALVLIGAVPLYNVAAVVLLTLLQPGGRITAATMKKTLLRIATNPIILSIAIGLLWSLLRLPYPTILAKSVSSLAAVASPMGLLALGACTDLKKIFLCWKPTLVCSAMKLVGFAVLFLPVAVLMGFRGEVLVAMLIMLASPATVSCFTMARSMGHEGTLSSGVIAFTTVASAFTFTLFLFLLRALGLV